MTSVTIHVEGLDKLIKKNKRLAGRVNVELKQVIKDTCHNIERRAKTMAPVDTGILRASIWTDIDHDGFGAYVGPPRNVVSSVMERGRRPGRMPPVDALVPWVKRHGMVRMNRPRAVYYQGVNVSRRAASMSYEKQARTVAFLIARKIGQRGLRPHWFMRTAMWGEEAALRRNLQAALHRAVSQA